MSLLTILRDNREQKGWCFENHDVDTEDVTLETGDYTLAEFCDYDDEKDTYYPRYAIERKSGKDFIESITRSRDRFKAEIKRASDWDSELRVLIEEPQSIFKKQRDFMQYRNVTWSQIKGTVDSWERYYNVEFVFTGSRSVAQQKTVDALSSRLRADLLSG